jgi:hypothetical protein
MWECWSMAVASRSCSRTMIDGHWHMAPIRSDSPLMSVGSSKSLHFLGHGALVDELEMRKCATHWVKMTSKSGQMHRRLQRNDIDIQMMLNDNIIYIYKYAKSNSIQTLVHDTWCCLIRTYKSWWLWTIVPATSLSPRWQHFIRKRNSSSEVPGTFTANVFFPIHFYIYQGFL